MNATTLSLIRSLMHPTEPAYGRFGTNGVRCWQRRRFGFGLGVWKKDLYHMGSQLHLFEHCTDHDKPQGNPYISRHGQAGQCKENNQNKGKKSP